LILLDEIKKKETKKKKNTPEDINLYLGEVKNLIDHYEEWFSKKLGRNSKKTKKKLIN